MTTASASDRTAPLALWRVASALLHTLFALFGGPEKLAAKHTLTASAYKLTCDWLRSAEALMRKLLFIEASAYPATPPRMRRKKHTRIRRAIVSNPDAPETWRVSFRAVAPQRERCNAKRLTRTASSVFYTAWPLAERFEALIRVHNDPTPYAKRLARRLYAEPQLIPRVLRAPDQLAQRIPEEADAQIEAHCARATPRFNSS